LSKALDDLIKKSESNLKGINSAVENGARKLIELAFDAGIEIRITQGLRTIDEQNELFNKGRDSSGNVVNSSQVVTQARGGHSYHNFGLAIDFVLIKGGYDMKYDGNDVPGSDWMEVVNIAKSLGFEAGADWTSFKDYPHFQITFDLSTADLRNGKKPTAAKIKAKNAEIDAAYAKIKKLDKQDAGIEIDVTVNGKDIGNGMLYNNTAYVPLRVIGNALHVPVVWDNHKKIAYVNGNRIQDHKLVNDTCYVQLRTIAEAYNARVSWENKTKTAGVIKDVK
jgi:peptidoglycan L-alanyl-D-glutamate endopeptidase CwlK